MSAPDFHSLPDIELIQLCLNSETNRSSAWETLILRYQRLIYSIPRRYGMTESESADVAQTVCLILLENLSQLRNRKGLAAWLITTTRRECWRWMRRQQIQTDELNPIALETRPDESAQPEEDVVQVERAALIRAALSRLEPRCQNLLTLLFYTEPRPSYDEIVSNLGLPEGSIGPTRARCLSKLMIYLEESRFFD